MIFLLDTMAAPFHAASESRVDLRRSAKITTSTRAELMKADFELVGTSTEGLETWESKTRHPTKVEDDLSITEWIVDYHDHVKEHGVDGLSKWLKGKPKLAKREV